MICALSVVLARTRLLVGGIGRSAQRVGDRGTSRTHRLLRTCGGVLGSLMLHLGIHWQKKEVAVGKGSAICKVDCKSIGKRGGTERQYARLARPASDAVMPTGPNYYERSTANVGASSPSRPGEIRRRQSPAIRVHLRALQAGARG